MKRFEEGSLFAPEDFGETPKADISLSASDNTPARDFGDLFERLSRSGFRSRFRLKPADYAYIDARGMATIRAHATDFIGKRLAPAVIPNDGKQTPMRGHPVFANSPPPSSATPSTSSWNGSADKKRNVDNL